MCGLLPLMATLVIFVAPAAAKGDDKQDCAAHKDQGHRIIACTRVIHLTPGDAVAYHNRGDARQRNGDLDTAIVDFTKAIEINPVSTSPRAMQRYRDLCVLALEARRQAA